MSDEGHYRDDTSFTSSKCPICGTHGSHACMGPQPKPDPGVLEVQELYDRMSAIHTVKPCGCEWTHDEQTKWCAHHVSGLQETITARERSITDLRYRVRELEAERDKLRQYTEKATVILEGRQTLHELDNTRSWKEAAEANARERDEWKAKAENVLAERDEMESERNATVRILRKQKKVLTQWLRDRSKERDEWKAKAEQAETERQNALQDGSICPDPDEHHRKIRPADKHNDMSGHHGWMIDGVLRCRDCDALESAHYCCYHMRWETQRGEKV